jgi:hypothetical protein
MRSLLRHDSSKWNKYCALAVVVAKTNLVRGRLSDHDRSTMQLKCRISELDAQLGTNKCANTHARHADSRVPCLPKRERLAMMQQVDPAVNKTSSKSSLCVRRSELWKRRYNTATTFCLVFEAVPLTFSIPSAYPERSSLQISS